STSLHSARAHPRLHSFPTRRSSDLKLRRLSLSPFGGEGKRAKRSIATAYGRVRGPALIVVPGHKPLSDRPCRCRRRARWRSKARSEEHTSELQSPYDLVCRLLLEKK